MDERPKENEPESAPNTAPAGPPPATPNQVVDWSAAQLAATTAPPTAGPATDGSGVAPSEPAPDAPVDWQTTGAAAPTPGRKKLVYVALAVAGLVLFGLVRTIIGGGSSSDDPYDVATREVGQKLLAMPEFKARYGDITSQEQAYQVGQEIALKGIPRLGDADLLRYWQLTNKMIGVADPALCGRVFKQTSGAEDAKKAARALDLESFRQLLDVTLLAFQAELRGDPVRPAPSSEALTTAFIALQTAMGPGITDAAAKLSDKSASDADVCAAGRSFLGAVLALGEPDRTVIARYMIAAAAGT
jgi:hypothetical protein